MRAVFAYIPVVHRGTLEFLDTYKDVPILLLDNEAGKLENPYLERDMRALSGCHIKTELEAHGFSNIEVVDSVSLAARAHAITNFIAPDDEIVKFFLEKYAPNVPVQYINVFLRWTKQISTTEFVVPPDRKITEDTFAREVLQKLTKEAEKSPDWWRQIAAMVLKEGECVATAHNKHFPSPHALTINGDPRSNLDAGQGPGVYTSIHAEASAIAQAARKGISIDGSDVYVTTKPVITRVG